MSPRKKKEGRERGCADVCKFVYVFACACVCEGKGKIEIQVERSRLVKEGSYPVLQTGMKACLVCICLRLLKPSPSLLSLTALFLLLGVTCLMSSLSAGLRNAPAIAGCGFSMTCSGCVLEFSTRCEVLRQQTRIYGV